MNTHAFTEEKRIIGPESLKIHRNKCQKVLCDLSSHDAISCRKNQGFYSPSQPFPPTFPYYATHVKKNSDPKVKKGETIRFSSRGRNILV